MNIIPGLERKVRDFQRPSLMFRIEDVLKYRLFSERYYGAAVDMLALDGDERVLDFGCGGGASTRCVLGRLGPKGSATCLDTSRYLLGKARKRLGSARNVEFIGDDVRTAGLREGSVDAVLIFHVIHEIPSGDRVPVVTTLSRAITNGGRLVIVEPTRPGHGMSPDEIRRLFGQGGLREETSAIHASHYRGLYRK